MSYFVQTTTTPRDLGDLPKQASARAHEMYAKHHPVVPAAVVRPVLPSQASSQARKALSGPPMPALPSQAAARARQAVGWNHDFYPKSGTGAYEATAGFFSRDGFGTGMLVGAAAVMLLGAFGMLPGGRR